MASSVVPDSAVNSDRSASRKKMKKRLDNCNANNFRQNSSINWKSDSQQQIYSSKLLRAIRQVQRDSPAPERRQAVHKAAYRALAATARGRSQWSRAMLANRIKLKFLKKNNITKQQRKVVVLTTGNCRSQRKPKVNVIRLKSKSLPSVQRKVRVLSRLVPGCREQSLPVVLEEVADYISALEMQVRAMSALAELLSVSNSSPPAGSASR